MPLINSTKKAKSRLPLREPSQQQERENEAGELVAVLVDAAVEIGERGTIGDYSRNDFYLWASQIMALMPKDREGRERFGQLAIDSPQARVPVAWPEWEPNSPGYEGELRDRPGEIVGLLMRRVLEGDALFFEAVASAVREAKQRANNKRKLEASGFNTRAVAVVAPMLEMHLPTGDPGWFEKVPKPARKGKVPFAIWKLCQEHNKQGMVPTRRAIRDHLKSKNLVSSNLSVQLTRLGLAWLLEGERPRKPNIQK